MADKTKELSSIDREDISIVRRVRAGDREAFSRIVERYGKPIFNLAYRMTGDPHAADDLTQDIFLKAYEKLAYFDEQNRFFTWLFTIGVNHARNYIKRQQVRSPHVVRSSEDHISGDDPEEDMLNDENSAFVLQGLRQLPVDMREAIVLRYLEGLPIEEIAQITGISLSAAKMRIYRGLEHLRKLMEERE